MNYEEALQKSLSVPWKIDVCNTGEDCWCRVIMPVETIEYTHRIKDSGEERIEEIDYIIPDGAVDKTTAEYIIEIHNEKVKNGKS